MNLPNSLRFAALAAGLIAISTPLAHAQGRGGGGTGTPGLGAPAQELYKPLSQGRTFTDLELTAITRIEEVPANVAVIDSVAKYARVAQDARTALTAASLQEPRNANEIAAKAKDLGAAELALASARAASLAPFLKKELPGSDTAKLQAVATNMETRAMTRVGRGGQ